jgi:rhodanese-related sulfurtransferase
MEQLIEFAGNHTLMVAAFFFILALLIWNLVTDPGSKGAVDATGATGLINREDALVIDVRPMADFGKGHIVDAINIPMNGFKNQLGQLEKHKNRTIVVSCRSGNQSQMACKILRQAGFEKVFNLRGGMMGWQSASLPVTRK